jgi:hypothetical protein
MRSIFWCSVLSAALVAGAGCKKKETVDKSADRMSKSVEDKGTSAGKQPDQGQGDLTKQRADYAATAQQRLAKLDTRINELSAKSDDKSKEAAAKLRTQRDEIATEVSKLSSETDAQWEKSKKDLDSKFDSAEKDLDSSM